jgi:dsRNA-specific ribonuclease
MTSFKIKFHTIYQELYNSVPPNPVIYKNESKNTYFAIMEINTRNVKWSNTLYHESKPKVEELIYESAYIFLFEKYKINSHVNIVSMWLIDNVFYKKFITFLNLGKKTSDFLIRDKKSKLYLFQASTHSSAINSPLFNGFRKKISSNEKFEWVGDRILNAYIATKLVNPALNSLNIDINIGTLDKFYQENVCNNNLAKIMKLKNLNQFLISHNLSLSDKISANYFEAIIGALSHINYEYAQEFMENNISVPSIDNNPDKKESFNTLCYKYSDLFE